MKAIRYLSLLMLLILAGCKTQIMVQSDYSPNTDFTKYKTYAWLPTADSAAVSGTYNVNALQAGLTKSVNEELRARGYTLDASDPDLLVVMHTMFETNTSLVREPIYGTYRYYSPGFYTGPYYDYYWPGYYTINEVVGYNVRTVQYKEGSVVIDIIDKETNHIVWRGWTENALKSDIQQNIDQVVSDLFDKHFPVQERQQQPEPLSAQK